MTSIRFLLLGKLELGEVIGGIASPPEWLRNRCRTAVRDSLRSLMNRVAEDQPDFLVLTAPPGIEARFRHAAWAALRQEINATELSQRPLIHLKDPAAEEAAANSNQPELSAASKGGGGLTPRGLLEFSTSVSVFRDAVTGALQFDAAAQVCHNSGLIFELSRAAPIAGLPRILLSVRQHGRVIRQEHVSAGCLVPTFPGAADVGPALVEIRSHSGGNVSMETTSLKVQALRYTRIRIRLGNALTRRDIVAAVSRTALRCGRQSGVTWLIDAELQSSAADLKQARLQLELPQIEEELNSLFRAGHAGLWIRQLVLSRPPWLRASETSPTYPLAGSPSESKTRAA